MQNKFWAGLAVVLVVTSAFISLVVIPHEGIQTERKPLLTSPADVGLEFENFVLSPADQALKIAGWWMPAESARATLVFIHGGGSNRHSQYFGSLKFYRAMVDRGIGLVVVDLRNHGDSAGDGVGLQFGRTEKHDAQAAIEWARKKTPDLPLFAMGISMGGATLIHAVSSGAELEGLILLDSVLDTSDAFRQGAWVNTGLPAALFAPSAWSASTFYGLPGGSRETLELASKLSLPILAIQDPDDPVTRAPHSAELARRNPHVTLWTAPAIPADHPDLAWKGRWGSHVSAFLFHPRETLGHIMKFINARIAQGGSQKPPSRQTPAGTGMTN